MQARQQGPGSDAGPFVYPGDGGWYVIGPKIPGNEQGRYGPYTEEQAGIMLTALWDK